MALAHVHYSHNVVSYEMIFHDRDPHPIVQVVDYYTRKIINAEVQIFYGYISVKLEQPTMIEVWIL